MKGSISAADRGGSPDVFSRRFFVAFFAAIIATLVSCSLVAAQESLSQGGWDEGFLESRREALLDEFKSFQSENGFERPFKVKTTERFIFVYDTSDAYLQWLSALTNEVAKAFDKFCARLDLKTEAPSEPLTVVVFATREEFDVYAASLRGDPLGLSQGQGEERKNGFVAGFYNHGSNRSVIYDMTDVEASRVANDEGVARKEGDFSWRKLKAEAKTIKTRFASGGNTSTIVHEISHQLAFNYGIFSRRFRQPDWVVEGMATTFEPTDEDAPLGWRFRNAFPVNDSRLRAFVAAANDDENLTLLDDIVTSDRFENELDADGYAASWALFYFCYRKKTKELKSYLETIKKRDPRKVYSEDERMKEFRDCFGDPAVVGKQFVKFVRDLNVRRIKASDR